MHQDESAPPANPAVPRLALLATFVGVTIVRYWFSSARHVVHISPDEPSQLAIARFLAGRRRWNMFDHATWQPGLGTLITPIYWFSDRAETVVRWGLGVNAVFGGLGAVLLVLLTRRLTGLPDWMCAVLATIVALAPASLSASAFIWAEPLISLSTIGTLLLLIRYYDSGRLLTAVAAVACSVGGYTTHSRLLPLIATTVLLTVGRELWRRRSIAAGTIAASALVMFGATSFWKDWLLDRIWDNPSNQNTVDSVITRAQQPLDVGEALLGQVWYQLIATLGVAVLGTVALLELAFRRRHADEPVKSSTTTLARLVILTTLPLVIISAIFMADRGREDQYIYGRYNDAVVWPIVVLGLGWLVARARHGLRRRDLATIAGTVIVTIGLGVAVNALHGDSIRERYGVRAMIAGVLPFVDGDDTLDVWRATLVATALFLIGMAVLVITHHAGRAGAPLLAIGTALGIGLCAVGAARTRDVADAKLNGWDKAAVVRQVDALVPPGLPLAVRTVPSSKDPVVAWVPQRQRYLMYQLYLPERSFVRDRGPDDDVGPYVFSVLNDPEMLDTGAELIWTDPTVKIGLWKEPSP
ncbi:MAG: hypothetical protein ABIW84_07735 [Ilumatobacteraceae bacterium]